MTFTTRRKWTYGLAALPAMAFLALQIWPLSRAILSTTTDAQGHFTLDHIRTVISDSLFLRGLRYNLLIPMVSVAFEALIGLAMALWFYYLRRGRAFWRTIAIVPFALPEIVYLLTAKLIFRQHGYLNSILFQLGGNAATVSWFQPENLLTVLVIILVDAWRVMPVVFLIVLMALEQMPESYLEAARVDSASRWQIIRLIQVPLAIPALLVALSLRAVDAFRIFATPFVLLGVEGMPVLTSVAYHYKMEANNAVAANVAALTLALALFAATAATLLATGRRRRSR
jgi:ABC-type sugar transport system permease subunit